MVGGTGKSSSPAARRGGGTLESMPSQARCAGADAVGLTPETQLGMDFGGPEFPPKSVFG